MFLARRTSSTLLLSLWVLCVPVGLLADETEESPLRVEVHVEPLEATVGDRLSLRVEVTLPPETRLDSPQLGPVLGPFAVMEGRWSEPVVSEEETRWVWSGIVAAFRTGELELPAIRIAFQDPYGEGGEVTSDPVTITLHSVLAPEVDDEEIALADLKPPASLPPDYGPLITSAGILGALLLVAGLAWWLQRRYASRLAAVDAPDDPFHRTPPHEWVYEELRKLLERRLAEQGQVELFFAEVSRIVKRYLGRRFRVELMEQTTREVPERLRQAGAGKAIEAIAELLERCDMVKFARVVPDPAECRAAIDAAYRVVDATRPRVTAGVPAAAGQT